MILTEGITVILTKRMRRAYNVLSLTNKCTGCNDKLRVQRCLYNIVAPGNLRCTYKIINSICEFYASFVEFSGALVIYILTGSPLFYATEVQPILYV
jgi:hypothetical protein